MSTPVRPIQPEPDPDTIGFFEATARGELALGWCPACARYLHPPLERCRTCGGPTGWRAVSGRGRVHSFIVVRRAVAPGYQDKPGHVIVLVELEEQDGLRLVGQWDDERGAPPEIGAAAETRLVDLPGGDRRVPVFCPMATATAAGAAGATP